MNIHLDPQTEIKLDRIAKRTGKAKELLVSEAVRSYLEDLEDYRAAIAVLEKDQTGISLNELKHRLRL